VPDAPPAGYTATDVRDWFALLDQPITDDQQALEAAYKQKRRVWQQEEREAGNVGVMAKVKMARARWVRELRPQLLDIVAEALKQHLDTLLLRDGAIPAGIPQAYYENLCDVARNTFSLGDDLVKRMVDEALQGIQVDAQPVPVTDLVAVPGKDSITLTWERPPTGCDEVIVRRGERPAQPPGGRSRASASMVQIGDGPIEQLLDDEVQPGTEYVYEVVSVSRGTPSQNAVRCTARTVSEVGQLDWEWNGTSVALSWSNPLGCSQITVFRREGARPATLDRGGAPAPADSQTELIWTGQDEGVDDLGAREGHTYHYLVMASFVDVMSAGVEVICALPARPDPVANATASYQGRSVSVSWEPVNPEPGDEYIVVRRTGVTPPTGPEDGQVYVSGSGSLEDRDAPNGHCYRYAVFSRRRGLLSRTAALTPVVEVLGEVSQLRVAAGDGRVRLSWVPPDNVLEVAVRRKQGVPPNGPDGGEPVRVTAGRSVEDAQVDNGTTYHYRVLCKYRPESGREAWSRGLTESATPTARPVPTDEMHARLEGAHVVCSWTAPPAGKVRVVRTAHPAQHQPGEFLPVVDVDDLGTRLVSLTGCRAVDEHPTPVEPYYTAFTLSGDDAVAGPGRVCVAIDDVTGLSWTSVPGGVKLQWEWPSHCASVVIARRRDQWPSGPHDPQAHRTRCSREQYDRNNASFIDEVAPEGGRLYYIVYAQAAGAPLEAYAAGQGSGCRATVAPQRVYSLQYSVRGVRTRCGLLRHRLQLCLEWKANGLPEGYAGFALVANGRHPPYSLDDGTQAMTWTPDGSCQAPPSGVVTSDPPEPEVASGPDSRVYFKLFHLDAGQAALVRVTHPDVSVGIKF